MSTARRTRDIKRRLEYVYRLFAAGYKCRTGTSALTPAGGGFSMEAHMETGSVVHIKDLFFELVQDTSLMSNKENGGYRPHYLCIPDQKAEGIFWAVPISSRVEKYRTIAAQKTARFGRCDTIVIDLFCGREAAYLIQNAFPVTERFLDHPHTVQGVPVRIGPTLQKEIGSKLRRVLSIYRRTGGALFTDVDKIMKVLMKH